MIERKIESRLDLGPVSFSALIWRMPCFHRWWRTADRLMRLDENSKLLKNIRKLAVLSNNAKLYA
ncbi:hypothetical protein VN24_22795 [Paenibacillus beijingensis]|uniref:Uncharacterized protein n=1 Tax=Paenibacillus beijingensis TaxID=1126833 RepID=A0A0D5NNI5_9BACL|nr:hypothetical protein VN24_22795 [Paenibacillus beijingensis]